MPTTEILTFPPENFSDYSLIDAGNGVKLERFGKYVTCRPEPQAVWQPVFDEIYWAKKTNAQFIAKSSSSGSWKRMNQMPERWHISYPLSEKHKLQLRLGLTSFKHLGVFPEQAVNWKYIFQSVKNLSVEEPKFLNLFAYTGAASIAAALAGANVTHCDSVKQVVTWANENAKLSDVNSIRWVIEDAQKFVQREVRRGNTYHGIILDPPAYGHGANGESWKLEDDINQLIADVFKILNPDKHFLILNTYSLGFSSLIIENLFKIHMHKGAVYSIGELYLPSESGIKLPLGVWGRIKKGL